MKKEILYLSPEFSVIDMTMETFIAASGYGEPGNAGNYNGGDDFNGGTFNVFPF